MIPDPGTEIQVLVGNERVTPISEPLHHVLGASICSLITERKPPRSTGLGPLVAQVFVQHPFEERLEGDRGDLIDRYPLCIRICSREAVSQIDDVEVQGDWRSSFMAPAPSVSETMSLIWNISLYDSSWTNRMMSCKVLQNSGEKLGALGSTR